MDTFLNAVLLLSTLLVSGTFLATGAARLTNKVTSGFTPLGAPAVPARASLPLGLAEVALGVSLLVFGSPGSLMAAYVAMIALVTYAGLAGRAYAPKVGPSRLSGQQMTASVIMCGISAVAIADSLTLQSALTRLANPALLAWIVAFGMVAAAGVWATRRNVTPTTTPDAAASEAVAH